ncbi:MAG TPA: CAP domain-containing protein, partial [Thermoanaerobaculia bacterium]|nr:CAP domain-containing protein [Thermoanaerobaculia bacterium]
GENIAARHLSADEAVAGWMSSSDHRRNILDPTLTSLGAGVAVGTYDHPYQVLWVLDLARPRG